MLSAMCVADPSESEPSDDAPSASSWLIVALGTERMAIPLASVREIVESPEIIAEAALPAEAAGVLIASEGRIVIWDGQSVLGQQTARPAGVALVLEGASGAVGLVVDAVVEVAEIDDVSIRTVPTLDDPARVVLGVARDAAGLVTVLDVTRLTRTLGARSDTT